METDAKTFIVETEVVITRRYRVLAHTDENPWDIWKDENRRIKTIDEWRGEEKAMSVEKG